MRTCLIVDDVEVTRFTGNLYVKELGLASIEVSNGKDALNTIKTNNNIDVVLLDWHLKKEDGLALLKEIRKLKPGLPVIMFSGVEGNDRAGEALSAGASGFITKPTTKEKLELHLKKAGVL